MGLRENIEKIVEDRQAEAIKKDLTRKLKTIVTILGFEIRSGGGVMSEGGFGYSASEPIADDWEWKLEDEEHMPTADLDAGTYSHGMYFDGLSSGFNLQIMYKEGDELIKVTCEGMLVYREAKGQLDTYLPSPQWEDKVESLFSLARKRSKMQEKEKKDAKNEKNKSRIKQVLDYLRRHWGV